MSDHDPNDWVPGWRPGIDVERQAPLSAVEWLIVFGALMLLIAAITGVVLALRAVA